MGGKPSTSTPADRRLKENRMADLSAAGRKKAASEGHAMSDGSFPVQNRADLARAILAIGRTDPSRRPAVKAFLKKRAAALGATDLLPQSWR